MWNHNCGKPLSEENKYYLACKAFRNKQLDRSANYNEHVLSWSQFGRDDLPDQNFTFWEWFLSMLLLTMNHLKLLWKKGYVLGFVEKAKAEDMLLQQPKGTFLLRFSDSTLGAVTIAYQKTNPGNILFR